MIPLVLVLANPSPDVAPRECRPDLGVGVEVAQDHVGDDVGMIDIDVGAKAVVLNEVTVRRESDDVRMDNGDDGVFGIGDGTGGGLDSLFPNVREYFALSDTLGGWIIVSQRHVRATYSEMSSGGLTVGD